MTSSIIITICGLLLLAYVFDITSSRTRIPSIILLLIVGWLVRQVTTLIGLKIPNLEPVLPVLGTLGLILIVLDGSLELEIKKSNLSLVLKSTFVAFLPILGLSMVIAYAFYYFDFPLTYKNALSNAIPLSVISSAVAIPSVKHLSSSYREFITYESSLSDVFGVVFFNFITLHEVIDSTTYGLFFLDIILILTVSFISTIGLAFLMSKIKHHVKFGPIIIIVILIYIISKMYHLPALLFIMLFGLFIGNLEELKHIKFVKKLNPEILNKEVQKFRELTTEFTFLIRTLFFILFGYLIETKEVLNTDTIVWAVFITIGIFITRALILLIAKQPLNPLLYISPRGLITILLFLSIPINKSTPLMNNSLIIQVIILTALIMMFGLVTVRKRKIKTRNQV